MKKLLLILAIFIGIGANAQSDYIYKLKFETEKQSQIIETVDSLAIAVKVQPQIIGYSQNLFSKDSTAIYEDGIFYDVFSSIELPTLNEFIINPYPSKFRHCFSGRDETNTNFVKP
ncbi:MAG: hypothetical protein QM487_14275 [Candidatus Marithrix sp.]